MCGRYTLASNGNELWDEFELESVPVELVPRFNIAPTQPVPAITDRRPGHVVMLRWGLIPYWAKDDKISSRLINARVESAATKPAFRDPFASRRALVLADGFYEWRRHNRVRQPFHFRLASKRPFAFAGLWDRWRHPSGETIFSCTILTGPANELVASVHDRMPIILPRPAHRAWLACDLSDPEALIEFSTSVDLEMVAVSSWVNSPFHEGPDCLSSNLP